MVGGSAQPGERAGSGQAGHPPPGRLPTEELGEAVLLEHQKIPLRSADCQNKNFIAIVIHGMQRMRGTRVTSEVLNNI